MRVLTYDVETTIKNNGHPFTMSNFLVCNGWKFVGEHSVFDDSITDEFLQALYSADLVIGCNLKFDIHWIRRYGADPTKIKRVWDIQLAHFIITRQKNISPSLNEISEYYGFGTKLDIVKTEYWDKGICTQFIPKPILKEYTLRDIELTENIAIEQHKFLTGKGL